MKKLQDFIENYTWCDEISIRESADSYNGNYKKLKPKLLEKYPKLPHDKIEITPCIAKNSDTYNHDCFVITIDGKYSVFRTAGEDIMNYDISYIRDFIYSTLEYGIQLK